ncbi:MAG: hypothetical protein ACT4TC_16445, partial [Myxococcaceae bacterium]
QVLAEEEEPPPEVQEDQEDWGFAETQHGTPTGADFQGEPVNGIEHPAPQIEHQDIDLGSAALSAVDAQGEYEVSGLAAEPNVQTEDWGNQVVEYSHEMPEQLREDLQSGEVPVYDLATDAALLAPEETPGYAEHEGEYAGQQNGAYSGQDAAGAYVGAYVGADGARDEYAGQQDAPVADAADSAQSGAGEGIRSGTGIHASFAPDPSERTPPPDEDPYAHSAYVEPYDETNDPGLAQAKQEIAYTVENAHGDALYQHEHLAAVSEDTPEQVPPNDAYPDYADEADAQLSALQNAEPHVDPTILADMAGRSRLIPDDVRGPFDVKADSVSVVVKNEMLTRLSGLLAMTGQIELTPERKRFRGRVTERNFGEGEEQVMRAKGTGVLVIENKGQLFQSSDLNDESAYFREDVVFAFEEEVVFENGNVPSDVAPDVQLVHLRGKGQVLLCLQGPLKSVPVKDGQSVTLPLAHLVGWYGSLSPRIIALVSDGKGKALKAGVELSGEGFALLAVPLR